MPVSACCCQSAVPCEDATGAQPDGTVSGTGTPDGSDACKLDGTYTFYGFSTFLDGCIWEFRLTVGRATYVLQATYNTSIARWDAGVSKSGGYLDYNAAGVTGLSIVAGKVTGTVTVAATGSEGCTGSAVLRFN